MAYKEEKGGDIVISGFEKGIADSPELGIGDMRSVNITSIPGEASVSFATAAATQPPTGQTGLSYSASAATDVFTVSSTTNYYDGMGINIDSSSLPLTLQALVVAGGGGGGGASNSGNNAGGGGAGGYQYNAAFSLGSTGTYTVDVGVGGTGNSSGSTGGVGVDGGNSSFFSITSIGGGGGGGVKTSGTGNATGDNGGSGGGGGQDNLATGPGGTGSVGQGNNGGTSPTAGPGSGGGGANAAGSAAAGGVGGNGGNGSANSITGSSVTYAGGGGGGDGASGGTGGTGGGGTGGTGASHNGSNATADTGGGGGGAGHTGSGVGAGGNGASGLVILSYATGTYTATGGVKSTSGSNTLHTYKIIILNSGVSGTSATLAAGNWSTATTTQNVVFTKSGDPTNVATRSVTFTNGSSTITWSSALTFTSTTNIFMSSFVVSATNLGIQTYYIGNITGTTFKLYTDPQLSNVLDVLGDITGTYDVPSFGTPVWSTQNNRFSNVSGVNDFYTFIIDSSGNAWYVRFIARTATGGTIPVNTIQYAGNIGHSSTATGADFGLAINWGYLFAVIGSKIDYIDLDTFFTTGPSTWVYGWKIDLNNTSYQHQSLAAADDVIYICNGGALASLLENVGSAFDPTNSSTYTYNTDALTLPSSEAAQCVAQLGTLLLVGGITSYIYPWDRVSTSYNYPLICADQNIVRIVSTNSNAYVFAGNRGRIYITNGQQVQLYKKIPDALSGAPDPYYTWEDAIYLRNKMYFTFSVSDNGGNALNSTGGIWALGIDAGQTEIQIPTAGSLFGSNQLSYGTYGGTCPVLFYNQIALPGGYGICGAWVNSGTGVDISVATPYTGTQTYIDADLMSVGTFERKKSFSQVEFKLSRNLVAGESVALSWRGNLTDSFTPIATNWQSSKTASVTSGELSDVKFTDFEKVQWLQFRVFLTSVASSPSYVRLTELRLR